MTSWLRGGPDSWGHHTCETCTAVKQPVWVKSPWDRGREVAGISIWWGLANWLHWTTAVNPPKQALCAYHCGRAYWVMGDIPCKPCHCLKCHPKLERPQKESSQTVPLISEITSYTPGPRNRALGVWLLVGVNPPQGHILSSGHKHLQDMLIDTS